MVPRRIALLLLLVLPLLAGCQAKSVSIVTEPSGADIFIKRIRGGLTDAEQLLGQSPTRAELQYDKDVRYVIEARLKQYRKAQAVVEWNDGKSADLHLKLEQYLKTVPFTGFELKISDSTTGLRLLPVRRESEGYIDTTEPCTNASECHVLEMSSDQLSDLTWVSASKTADNEVVFQCVHSFIPARMYSPTGNETLQQIAEKHDLSVQEIRAMNKLPDLRQANAPLPRDRPLMIAQAQAITQIYKKLSDGTGASPLTPGKTMDLFPTYTWQGGEVVMSSNHISTNPELLSLWKVKTETSMGGALTRIAPSQIQDYSPSVSQEKVVFFTSITPGGLKPEIWSISLDGRELTQIVDNGEFPQVSATGDIIFLRALAGNKNRQIWRMTRNGSGLTQLTSNEEYDISSAAWSPDGQWIVFSSNQQKNKDDIRNYSLWLMRADGKQLMPLTENGSWDDSPSWGHSGKVVYFRSNRGGKWRIWRLSPILPVTSAT